VGHAVEDRGAQFGSARGAEAEPFEAEEGDCAAEGVLEAMNIRDLAHDPRAIADLRWYWSYAAGDLGLKSNFEPMRARLEAGGRTGGAPILELDEKCIDAATRERHIRRALERLTERDRGILRAAFGSSDRDLPAFGRATGVVPMTDAAQLAHWKSRTNRPLEEWLARLVCHADKDPVAARTMRVIRREADTMLGAALMRFSNARRRR
jgi:hypothetical protein